MILGRNSPLDVAARGFAASTEARTAARRRHAGDAPHFRKGTHRGRRTTWIALTPQGRRALSAHVAALRALIDGIQ